MHITTTDMTIINNDNIRNETSTKCRLIEELDFFEDMFFTTIFIF